MSPFIYNKYVETIKGVVNIYGRKNVKMLWFRMFR